MIVMMGIIVVAVGEGVMVASTVAVTSPTGAASVGASVSAGIGVTVGKTGASVGGAVIAGAGVRVASGAGTRQVAIKSAPPMMIAEIKMPIMSRREELMG